MAIGKIAFRVLLAIVCLSIAPQGNIASAQEGAEAPVTAADPWGGDSVTAPLETPPELIVDLKGELTFQKWAAYLSVAATSVLALGVFLYRRRRLFKFSRTAGAATAVVLSFLLFALLVELRFTEVGADCAAAVLEMGEAATDYDDICRAWRESGADAFGFASAYRVAFVPEEEGYIVPMEPDIVSFLAYFSVPFAALALFFALRPAVERLLVRV